MADATHESSDHFSDLDIDGDFQRLSAALDSITDEVDAIERKSKSSKPQAQKISLGDHFQSSDGDSQSSDPPLGASKTSIKHIDDIQLSDDDDDDDDDMSYDPSLDGSIAGELDALRLVAQEIERELQDQDGVTMQMAIENIEKNSDDPKNRILTSDDHEIIRKALLDEVKKYEPKNGWERFMKRYQLDGISEQDKTYALTTVCTLIWSIVFRLLYKVTFGEM